MKKLTCWAAGISLAIVSLAFPNYALAGFKDGNELLDDCGADKGSPTYYQSNAACTAFIIGVYDGLDLKIEMEEVEKLFCLPPNVRAGQLREIVTNYLKSHPEQRHWPAAALVAISLKDAFPCPKKGGAR